MKQCKTCEEIKTLTDFYSGRNSCKVCVIERVKRSTNKQTKTAYDKDRRKKKGDELRAYDRERAKLPHRRAAHNEDTRKRRAKLKDAIPDDYDREGVLAMYKLAQKISNLTGVQMHVDHTIPLACGGEHNVKNLQLLAGTLNIAKGANVNFQLNWEKYPK